MWQIEHYRCGTLGHGESSANYLRGESMTDVIFNGATTRKPVGQASIELVFDNHEGKVLGNLPSLAKFP